MNDSTILVQIATAIAATVTPVIVLVRLVAGGRSLDLAEPSQPSVSGWPRGVQEEELVPWAFARSTV